MKNILNKILFGILLLLLSNSSFAQNPANLNIDKKLLLKAELARLWIDDAIYTRQAIFCLIDRLPGTEETLYRLYKNQEDMGEVFTKYYGRKAGDEFCQLISSNTALLIRIIREKDLGNSIEINKAEQKLHNNYDEIIDYLCKVNPKLNKEVLKKGIYLQYDLLSNEIDLRERRAYDADIENFDLIITECLNISHLLSEALYYQFPAKFKD